MGIGRKRQGEADRSEVFGGHRWEGANLGSTGLLVGGPRKKDICIDPGVTAMDKAMAMDTATRFFT